MTVKPRQLAFWVSALTLVFAVALAFSGFLRAQSSMGSIIPGGGGGIAGTGAMKEVYAATSTLTPGTYSGAAGLAGSGPGIASAATITNCTGIRCVCTVESAPEYANLEYAQISYTDAIGGTITTRGVVINQGGGVFIANATGAVTYKWYVATTTSVNTGLSISCVTPQ